MIVEAPRIKMHVLACCHGILISSEVVKPIKNNSFNVQFSEISPPDLLMLAVVSGYILLLPITLMLC